MKEIKSRTSSRNRVLSHLREGISDGTYPVGSRLPSERELSFLLGVSRPTTRHVLTLLQEERTIYSNGGNLLMVSDQMQAILKKSLLHVLKNTVVVVSNNPAGITSNCSQPGWSDWIDQGVLEETNRHRLHHLAFQPSRLADDDWEQLLEAMPYGVVFTDLIEQWSEGLGQKGLERMGIWRERGLPVVVYGNAPEMQAFDRVCSDHELGGYLLTRALLEAGRKNILMMGTYIPRSYWLTERYQGYCRAMQEFGQAPLPAMELPDVPYVDDFQERFNLEYRHLTGCLAPHIIATKVDAIIAPSDGLVPATIAACRALGKVPNKEIVITGYDHYWEESFERVYENEPPLFSIDKRNAEAGVELVKLLNDRVSGNLPPEPQKRLITPVLIGRKK